MYLFDIIITPTKNVTQVDVGLSYEYFQKIQYLLKNYLSINNCLFSDSVTTLFIPDISPYQQAYYYVFHLNDTNPLFSEILTNNTIRRF